MKSKPERHFRWLLWALALVGIVPGPGQQVRRVPLALSEALARMQKAVEYLGQPARNHPGRLSVLRRVHDRAARSGTACWPPCGPGAATACRSVNPAPCSAKGSGSNTPDRVANALFAGVSIIAALAIIYWSTRRASSRDVSLCAALGLILAGTLGNLYDRLVFGGVRDFLYFYWINWPVFNIADCCLVCGASLLLLQAFLSRPVAAGKTAADVPQDPGDGGSKLRRNRG